MMILEAKEDQSDGAQSGGGIPRMLRSVKGRPALTPSDASSGEDSSSSEESSSSEDLGITRFPLPRNNGNLSLHFFWGNFPIVLLHNIY